MPEITEQGMKESRQVCGHCGLRVYLDETSPIPSLRYYRHHGSNLRECPQTFAEPGIIASHCQAPQHDDYVAWVRYTKTSIVTCDSDAPGAFKVYRAAQPARNDYNEPFELAKQRVAIVERVMKL